MFLKLTNANPELKDTVIVINSKCIVSIFEQKEKGSKVAKTFIYGGENGTWLVKEKIDEIFDLLDSKE